MKALTLWQPWASLIVWGEKQYETRSWTTNYRGPLAIHAAVNRDETLAMYEANSFYRKVFDQRGLVPRRGWSLPYGVIVATVDLVSIEPTEEVRLRGITQQEENFGDWSTGRYAWKLENVRALHVPIAAIGRQGLWECTQDLARVAVEDIKAR